MMESPLRNELLEAAKKRADKRVQVSPAKKSSANLADAILQEIKRVQPKEKP